MKKFFVVVFVILIFLTSCIDNKELKKQEDILKIKTPDYILRMTASAYNKGTASMSLKNSFDTYSDRVIFYYDYFKGNNNSIYSAFGNSDQYIDKSLSEYISKKIKSPTFKLFDNSFFPILTKKSLEDWKKQEKRAILIYKVKKVIETNYSVYWNKIKTKDLSGLYNFDDSGFRKKYAENIVDSVYTFISSKPAYNSSIKNEFYKNIVIKDIPIEYLLAVMVVESRLFPFSYRIEKNESYYYAGSFGLSHILFDSDKLGISGIGNKKIERYTFDILNEIYFSKKPLKDVSDLFNVNTSIILCSIFLQLLIDKAYTITK